MNSADTQTNYDKYNTSINIIGGLRDVSVIVKAIRAYFDPNHSTEELIIENNELNLRTERSRIRINRAISHGFLDFRNADHKDLIKGFFLRDPLPPDRELVLFWQFCHSNRTFRDLSTQVYMKNYFSGRAGITKEDVIAYLKVIVESNQKDEIDWSEKTISILATKFLNLLTKLNLLEGARNKSFKYIRLSEEALVLFVYFAKLHEPNNRNLLTNEFLPLCFVPPGDVLNRIKSIAKQGYLKMSYDGVDLNIDLTTSYQEICNVLYN